MSPVDRSANEISSTLMKKGSANNPLVAGRSVPAPGIGSDRYVDRMVERFHPIGTPGEPWGEAE